jgi:hypothetical protein
MKQTLRYIISAISEDGTISSKRILSMVSAFVMIQITQVWLFTDRSFDTTQFIFLVGFWMFLGAGSQYLTLYKKNLMQKNIENTDGK